jgi:hypothetical protein
MYLAFNKYHDLELTKDVNDNVVIMKIPDKQQIAEAQEEFGNDIVDTVLHMINMSDPDTSYCLFADLEMHKHVVCLEQLYFGT